MKLALIKNSAVKSVVDVSTEEEAQELAQQNEAIIDITTLSPQPQVGWFLSGNKLVTNGTNGPIKITRLGMRRRFTFTELCALETSAQSIIQVKVLLNNLMVATYVDLTRADTIAGLGLLVSLGLLTSDRMTQILNNPLTDDEKYIQD